MSAIREWFARVKVTAIVLIAMVLFVTVYLAMELLGKVDSFVSNEILALIVGTGLGGAISLIGQTLTDPPQATIPAQVHVDIVRRLTKDM